MTPDLALQQAVRSALIASPQIALFCTPERIRSGAIRPEHLPAIVLTPARVTILGWAAGGQVVAEIAMQAHIWAVDDGTEAAQQIAAGAMKALLDAPAADGFQIDSWDRPALVWLPDPDPALTVAHAAISLRAAIRWRE